MIKTKHASSPSTPPAVHKSRQSGNLSSVEQPTSLIKNLFQFRAKLPVIELLPGSESIY